jgi:hypothetical protein
MKPSSKVLSAALVVAVLASVPSGAAFADAWTANGMGTPNGTMVAAIAEQTDGAGASRRISHINNADGSFEEFLCPDGPTAERGCSLSTPGIALGSNAVLPVCISDSQTDCIEALSFGKKDEALRPASLIRQAAGQTYPAIAAFGGLPAGGTISLWDAPGLKNSGGTTKYAIQVNQEASMGPGDAVYRTTSISASIVPISDKSGAQYKASKLTGSTLQDGKGRIGGWEFATGCALTEENYCGVAEDFAPDSKFSLTIRVSNQITGWFKGRIQNPTVTISKFSETNNRIVMTAEPVSVPRLAAVATASNTSDKAKSMLSTAMGYGYPELFKGDTLRTMHPDKQDSISWVEEFREAARDTAAGISTLWNFSTLADGQYANKCFADKTRVVGVVTTNATALAVGTPEFEDSMLDYKVAGLHYAPDGKTLNEGTYDLVMRSDVARCLYGFSKAPISAKISVVGEGGESKVATTVVSEKDGWLKLAAYGFTFSSPTISVKLSQAKPAAKKTTITCVKGKLSKKVTAVGPKCPAGYKKK